MDPERDGAEVYDDAAHRQEAPRTEKPMLSRIASRRSVASSVVPPPDGGLVAWTQVLMAHFVMFNTWGAVNSFGVYQTYYVDALHHPRSDISWIGSVQIFLLFGFSTFSGRALDAGLFRLVFGCGIMLQLLGVFMTSLATKYWQVFLAQGICTGIGEGLMFCPAMALVATYFSKNRSLALACVSCGSATGGLVFPAMVRELLPSIGFAWTVRATGFLQLALNGLAFAFMRTRIPPRTTGPIVDWAAFKEKTYSLLVVGIFFSFWAIYFAFFYVGSFAQDVIGVSYADSINLIILLNGVGIISRLVPAYVADRWTGPLNLIIPYSLATGILVFAWSGVADNGGLYGWTIVYGLISNGVQSLWPPTLSSLTTDIKKTGSRMGMGFTCTGFACLTGPPLAGALIQAGNGSYLYAQMWGGSSLVIGSLILLAARYTRTGWTIERM